jgi:two-component system C4-dicarboxylate transport sensor histidine kinase DctB
MTDDRDAVVRASESSSSEAQAERLAALQGDNRRLRELLAAAGRLAEFGRFAAKLNHELRQPLFAIKGLAQLLLERNQTDADEVRDFARHIVEQSERLATLVNDLRHLSIPAPREAQPVVEVSPVVLRVASMLDWRFRRGVTLRTEFAPNLPAAAMASHELEQILVNLLSNALDAVAGRPGPLVQVRAQAATLPSGATTIEIFLADNGSGVPRSVRERLFVDFFTTKGHEEGTGLGLAVSRELARAAGGELVLLDSPGAWNEPATTAFKLTLLSAATTGPGAPP